MGEVVNIPSISLATLLVSFSLESLSSHTGFSRQGWFQALLQHEPEVLCQSSSEKIMEKMSCFSSPLLVPVLSR